MVNGLILALLLLSEGDASVQRLIFEKNKGQAPADVHYLAHTDAYELDLNRGALVFHFGSQAIRVRFDGELNKLVPQGHARLDGLVRFVNAPDTNDGKVPKFASVKYESLYTGIDFMCYGRSSQLECDFVILPTGNPHQIRATIEGADGLELDQAGALLIHIGSQIVRIRKPTAYQLTRGERRAGERQPIEVQYRIRDNDEVSFVIGEYNRSLPLIIDPR
jgi:hypothetical protein